jgi:hypothetical protein
LGWLLQPPAASIPATNTHIHVRIIM